MTFNLQFDDTTQVQNIFGRAGSQKEAAMAVIHRAPERRQGGLKQAVLFILMAAAEIAIAMPAAIVTAG